MSAAYVIVAVVVVVVVLVASDALYLTAQAPAPQTTTSSFTFPTVSSSTLVASTSNSTTSSGVTLVAIRGDGAGCYGRMCYYTPAAITVMIGRNNTVIWTNYDSIAHTVTSTGFFDSGSISAGSSFAHTFTTPGTYHYFCVYHPWMNGTVTVLAAS